MTYGAFTQDFAPYEAPVRVRNPIPQTALCAIVLALSTTVGLWALYARPLASATEAAPVQRAEPVVQIVPRAVLPKAMAKRSVERDPALLYPSLTSGYAATTFAQTVPLRASFESRLSPIAEAAAAAPIAVVPRVVPTLPADASSLVADVPLPAPRPAGLLAASPKAPSRPADRQIASTGEPAAAAPAAPGFFEKMFGGARPTGTALAYAAPEDGGLGSVLKNAVARPGGYDRLTAVYDIEAHTVYLPDGTRLEAHSGLGPSRDNPASVALRMRGVTPPNLYELTPREALFHGVRALRLTPLGGTTYGRAGLLAHTYMLRGRIGESNGCVVFKDYQAFLRAYDSGAIRRLAVVARMN